MRLNAFNFNCTWRCILDCPYCGYKTTKPDDNGNYHLSVKGTNKDGIDKEFDVNGELHWAYWLTCLNRLRPYHLEFCGGEPTLYDGFIQLTQHMPYDCSYAVTSNTLLTDVIKHVHPRNSLCWTASYHYKQFDKFRLNVDLLQRRGFRVNVTTVITPDNWKEADEMLSSISSMGVGMTVQPGITVSFSWDDHQDILDHFKKRQRELRYSINPLDRPAWEPRDPVAACSAGTNYFMLFPDGQVYRCLTSTIFWDKKPLGHIKDFVPNAFEHPCPEGCICGCDVDAKNGKWDDADAHLRTAIR